MTIEDVKFTIKNHILNSISQRELFDLCDMLNIPPNGRRMQIQKRLIDSIVIATNPELLQRILYTINGTYSRDNNLNIIGVSQVISSQARETSQNFVQNGINNAEIDRNINYQANGYNQRTMLGSTNSRLYCISNEILDSCPINLRPEIINGVDPLNIFIPNYTKYPSGYFNAPSTNPTFVNGRVNMPNVQLPYCVKNTVISSSQFYCCQVVLHPLCLLIPKPTPNVCQPTRIMSKMPLQFTLSNNARHLITTHRTQVNNKRFYKWQVLIRFGVYDPARPFPNSPENITNIPEYIPPYLTLFVNNVTVPLWDILPSNSTAKEGKRHPRPINISDYLKFSSVDEHGYRQTINVNWWQTPGVYQYYYFAVYLERKLAVSELFNRFVNKTHHVQMPISFTMNFIRDKFSSNNHFRKKADETGEIEDDDDLVISSVLPISLLCPIGKSRITCPLRGVHCQHLQCFDAHLYLMMNERRSVWKCPVCDSSATLNELFVDEFFLKILQDFSNNEDLTEVNVNPDGSYVPIAVKESREHKQHIGNIISNIDNNKKTSEDKQSTDSSDSTENQPVILLESDEEDNQNKISINKTTSSIASSNNNIESVTVQKPHLSQSKQLIIPSLTIDLTSDSEDEKESKISHPISSISPSLHMNKSSLNQQIHSHNHSLLNQQLPHQYIAPKIPNNNFVKSSESSRNVNSLNYPQSSSSTESISLSNPYQNFLNNPSSSQPKVQQFIWMPQNQRFPSNRSNEMFNNYMPQLKPCYPAQNFVNMIRPPAAFPTINSSSCPMLPLLPRPIKVDPHLNLCTVLEKESRKSDNQTGNLQSKVNSIQERKQKPDPKRSSSIRNPNARRSSRILNQHRKVYRENSFSDENSDSDDSDIIGLRRTKRRSAFDDSTSSSSSVSNRKRRRLVPEPSDEENSNKEKLVHQSDLMTNLKYPLVILNKLDPVVLKVYLQQNEISNDVSNDQLRDSAFPVPDVMTGANNDSGFDGESHSNTNHSGFNILI